MKFLEVNKLYHPHIGGVESIVKQISEGLKSQKNADKNSDNRGIDSGPLEVEVLCCNKKGRGKEERINGIKVKRTASWGVHWGMPLSLSFLREFRKEAKSTDIIDIHLPFPLANLALLFCRTEAKIVVHYHSDIVRQRALGFLINPLIKNTLKRADKIIVSSPKLKENSPLLQNFQDKCEVIPFGIDLEDFDIKKDQEIQKKIKSQYGDFALFVGRLNYYKGVEYLIDAMKDVDVNLVIIGEGPELPNIKSQISNVPEPQIGDSASGQGKLEDKVCILNHRKKEDLINFYAAAKVFVLPSIYKSEAFGIVLLEAMAGSTSLVTTELGTGTSWVNQDGETGLVVPPKDAEALAEAINKIVENDELAEKFGNNARKRLEEMFTQERFIRKTAKIFNQLTC